MPAYNAFCRGVFLGHFLHRVGYAFNGEDVGYNQVDRLVGKNQFGMKPGKLTKSLWLRFGCPEKQLITRLIHLLCEPCPAPWPEVTSPS